MNPSRLFILRPVATSLLMIALLLTGMMAYRMLPIAALPQVDYPIIQVLTLYPGASPEVTTSSITAPLERQFGQMPGLEQMTSQNSNGASVITLQFGLETSLDTAEQEVQAAINAASNLLPADLPNPPVYNKVNPADTPIMTLAITSKTMPLTRVQDLIDTRVAAKISQIPGVGLVSLSGGQRPAVRVQVNPRAVAALGLDMENIRTTVNNANVNGAKGSFDGPERSSSISANDQLRSPEEYRQLIIAYQNGSPIRLGDVASVVEGAENSKLAAWADRDPAIILNVQRQPGANVIQTVDRIKTMLPTLQSSLPGAIEVQVLTDRTVTVRASVDDVEFELVLAVALVVMVVFLFLRNLSATIIPGVAVPLSLIGTFAVMYLWGFSINNLTMMALTIAAGFVVDDAIVMVENIARYIEEGEKPLQAALKGAQQIGFTIISLTFSLIAVLIPLLFMGDIVGRLFREFAITLAVAIVISMMVSLTLTPMMCAKLLRHVPDEKQGRFYHVSGQFFDRMIQWYGKWLNRVLDYQRLTLGVAVFTVLLTVLLYIFIPKGFFPQQDTGLIQGITEAPETVSFAAMNQRQQALTEVLLKDPDVASVSSFIGVDGTNTTLNSGRMQIDLVPLAERSARAPAIIQRLQQQTETQVAGIRLYMQPVQDLTIEGKVSRTQYQFTLDATDMATLEDWVPKLVSRLQQDSHTLTDVTSDLQNKGLQVFIDIDRDAAGRLDITPTDIANALYNAFGQRLISTIFTQSNQYRVVLEASPDMQRGPETLNDIYLNSQEGKPIPLSAVAAFSTRTGPVLINHLGQFPAVTVSFNLAEDSSLGEAIQAIETAKQAIQLPDSVSIRFQGAAEAFQAALSNQLWLILAAIVTMYIVLGVLYESYIHPITILSTLPSAGVGALLALMISGNDLSMMGIIGIILLIGIVKKNAIMMIDFALDAERHQHLPPREAIYQACLLRFRPILMTTMAALLAAFPMMLGSGFGSELRHPMGVTMVGGLIFSQVLTLFTTPVIYLFFDRLAIRLKRRAGHLINTESKT